VRWLVLLPVVLLMACAPDSDEAEAEDLDAFGPGQPQGKADATDGFPAMAQLPAGCDLERPLQVFFTPDDPAFTLELSLIDKVRALARAAGQTHPEGQNPFRIRYAVYNMTHDEIARHLAAAEGDGVDVQVLVESDQLTHEWVAVDDIFRARGLEVALDHTALDAAARTSADLVGVKQDGLMHLKTRIFEAPGFQAVLSGSLNPNGSAGANEETLHLIRDPKLIARYVEGYEAVLDGKGLPNRWDEGAAVNVLFSPAAAGGQRAATRLLEWLAAEEEQILLMIFSLRNVSSPAHPHTLLEILKQKKSAGVPVYVITDRKQSDGIDLDGNRVAADDWLEDSLRQAGIPVYEAVNDAAALFGYRYPYAAMHHKVAVLGRTKIRVITDASNWTAAALGSRKWPEKNVESQLFIDSDRLDGNATGRRYLAQWLRVLARYAAQSEKIDGELPAAEVAKRLHALAGWPEVGLSFSARATTAMGEEIYAVGDRDELGRWGATGPGVRLATDGARYPEWSSVAPTMLPIGARLEWKLVARAQWGTRWEAGANRVDVVGPRVCGADGGGELRGVWR
jgi:hypothetical protein